MRSIPLLAVDATDIFDEIAAAKQMPRRRRLQAVRAKVLVAYQGYEDAAPEVGGLERAQLTDLQKEAMRHAYTVETEPMTVLRGTLLKRVIVARCPFFVKKIHHRHRDTVEDLAQRRDRRTVPVLLDQRNQAVGHA